METLQQFRARMDGAKAAAFAEFLAAPHLANFMAKAPRPELKAFMTLMLEAAFNRGCSFGVTKMLAELENVRRTEL